MRHAAYNVIVRALLDYGMARNEAEVLAAAITAKISDEELKALTKYERARRAALKAQYDAERARRPVAPAQNYVAVERYNSHTRAAEFELVFRGVLVGIAISAVVFLILLAARGASG